MLQLNKGGCAVIGDQDQLVERHRQESLRLHVSQLNDQAVVEPFGVEQHHRLLMQSMFALLEDLGGLIEGAEAAAITTTASDRASSIALRSAKSLVTIISSASFLAL